jgi:hypothetical protein
MLLGVTGLARSGKDHAARYLARHLALSQYAFAEPLKTMLKSVFGDHFHEGDRSDICPETCKSYRVMMQTLGTEWGRELMNPQIWVNLVARRWKEINSLPAIDGMVLSDVRFDSEAEWITLNGGVIIEIVRPEHHSLVEKVKTAVGLEGHVSEKGIARSYITHTIVNDGSLTDFDISLMGLIDQLKEG